MTQSRTPGTAPLKGVKVLEVAFGVSTVGAGMAASLPGSFLRDFGAEVQRVQPPWRSTLDKGVEYARVWNRGKDVVELDPDDAGVAATLAAEADVVILAGPESAIEARGLGVHQLAAANPRLVGVRIRPATNALGPMEDIELLVAARAGVPTQIRGHRQGIPVFPDLAIGQAGAGLSACVGALAGLFERERTGAGCWAETSLYDGMMALLPMIIGRVEHHSPSTTLLWHDDGPGETICYRCADDEYVQLWFGAKGAYEGFLAHMGEPPSEAGYNADLRSGAMVERGRHWAERFATRDRDYWLEHLAGHDFRCEPVLRPGEALGDPHVEEIGLAVEYDDPERGRLRVLGAPVRVTRVARTHARLDETAGPMLAGVKVLDLSAYLAGPVTPLVLAELGADVVKVEPPAGDVHRNMEPMFAAGQRGKRALALDLKAPDAPRVLERLFRWSDVVHHNSRLGMAERLGYDEATVRSANPDVVYCFASGFGDTGPRAPLPANDQLVQALSGIEKGQAGYGGAPSFLIWGTVDVAGGWVAATGVLAALYARRRTGTGQSVRSNLLGAGMTLKSGAFMAGQEVVSGPSLDADQRGYGAAYRLYEGSDGAWFALAVPDAERWRRLRTVIDLDELGDQPPALRTTGGELQDEELALEKAFSTRGASSWVASLRAAGVPAELVPAFDRSAFCAAVIDDPVNRQLGRVVQHHWGDRGLVEQPKFPPRMGPNPAPGAGAFIAGLGEHTDQILAEVGFDEAERAGLAAGGTVGPQHKES